MITYEIAIYADNILYIIRGKHMELLLVAIIIGILCMTGVVLFCLFSRSKESTVYCVNSGRKTSRGSVKNCNIEGFLK